MKYFRAYSYWLLFSLIVAVACVPYSSCVAQSPVLPTSLRWYAEIAKQRGQSAIQIGHIAQPMQQRTPHEVVQQNDLVLGTIESSSQTNDDFVVFTWYRLRLAGTATTRLHMTASSDPREKTAEIAIPTAYKNLGENEILVRVRGGSTKVDGVAITQNTSVQMALNRKYLLFLKPLIGHVYEYGAETEPLPSKEDGTLALSSGSQFSKQFEKYPNVPSLFSEAR
ncbi:hypothetical protein [Granulicella arctica]|uniref:hypothetical protein n=1 Tax=Granulicella arctica TaxID=940613 RepID=UPI0021DFF1CA|nr:hypothetical protein [Granulicella arctica]